MKATILTGVLCWAAAAAHPQPGLQCDSARTQLELNECASREYASADQHLNRVYQRVAATLDDESAALLRAAQIAWLRYRDAHCRVVAKQYEGGSGEASVRLVCLARLTKRRADEIENTQVQR